MRRTFQMALLVVLVAQLAGCGSGPRPEESRAPAASPETETPGATQSFPAVADTHLESIAPTANYGGLPYIWCGREVLPGAPTHRQRMMLRFDLSSLPQTATVTKAILTLYCNQVEATPSVRVRAYRTTAAWEEMTATWNVMANAYDASEVVNKTLDNSMGGKSVRWNITAFAQAWVADPTHNYGVFLRTPEERRTAWAQFASRSDPFHTGPSLSVTYTP